MNPWKRFLPVLLLTGVLSAQNHLVHPARYGSLEGATSSYLPFGEARKWSTQIVGVRCQQIHDALSSRTVVIRGMSLRRDAGNTLYHPGWSVRMELILSTATVPAARIGPKFDANAGKDAVTVIAPKTIHFPAFHPTWAVPKPFDCPIPFDPGKTFTLKGGASLCWEVRVTNSDLWRTNFPRFLFDALKPVDRVTSIPFGHGCYAPHRLQPAEMRFHTDLKNYTAWDLLPTISNGPAYGWGVLLASTGRAPTPIPVGGPFCRLYLDPAGLFPVTPIKYLDFWGRLRDRLFYLPIPKAPEFQGVSFRTQWLLGTTRRWEAILTNAAYVSTPMPWATPPWTLVGSCTAAGRKPSLLTEGVPRSRFGLIVRFETL